MTLPKTVRAAVQTGDRMIELMDLPLRDREPGEVLLEVEGCGMCGSDVESYRGAIAAAGLARFPLVAGHEPVGRIVEIDSETAARWGVGEGTRVAVEPFVPCGVCARCLGGDYRLCANRFIYSCTPTTEGAGLWGGFAEYMVLHPNTIVHAVPEHVSIQDAVLFNPFGAGFEWAYRAAGTSIGDTVLVLGPGQRGLASVVAAREAGAATIIVTGLARDAAKLDLAREFGADHTIRADEVDVVEAVREITGGAMADRVIDVSSVATQPVLDAVEAARPGGTIVLAGLKDGAPIPDFVSDKLVFKDLTIRGALGVSSWSFAQAIRIVAAGGYPFERLHTHTLTLDEVERGVLLLESGADVIHITVVP